jgi:RNA polymerase-binding transcription factor DksA
VEPLHFVALETIRTNSGTINRQFSCSFLKVHFVLSGKKAEHFKQVLETRIAELNRVLAAAEQETRASAARHADPADQAAAEYERQSIVHKSNTARKMLKTLTQGLERIQHRNFGKCAECR